MITTAKLEAEQAANLALYSHMAFFTTAGVPQPGVAIGSLLEIGRVAITKSQVGNKITCNWEMATTTANCLSTTVSAASSSTSFTLTSVTGLATSGDLIQIKMSSGTVLRTITNRLGNVVTIDLPLTGTPANGTVVNLMISQRGLVQSGTNTANSGTLVDIQQYIFFKDSTMGTGTASPVVGSLTDTLE